MAWAWWPSGQYQPVRANQGGTLAGLARLVSEPVATARPSTPAAQVQLTPGTHLAVAMIPVGGATRNHPALFIITPNKGKPAIAILSPSTLAAFPFTLPSASGPGGIQAVAVGTKDGGVTYDVAYSLVTVSKGAPVTETNSAYALANCKGCTTVAVSLQVVLVVGQSKSIAPINAAGALNYDCPACTTTAIADQLVVTLKSQLSPALMAKLDADLKQLNALPELGANGSPAAVASAVAAVQQQIDTQLDNSGLLANSSSSSTGSTNPAAASTSPPPGQSSASGSSTNSSGQSPSPAGATSAGQAASTTSSTTAASSSTSSTPASPSSTATTTAPSGQSSGASSSTTTTASSG